MRGHPPVYMVQGFYFQERSHLGIAMVPIDGAAAVIKRGMFRDMFAGLIGVNDLSLELGGELIDIVGSSVLSSIELDETSLSFDKQYKARNDIIHYDFHLEDGLWVGSYFGELVGDGKANCVLTPIPERLHIHSS